MHPHQHPDDEPGMAAPAKLARALSRLQKTQVFVPPEVDERILKAARQHLARIPRSRFLFPPPAWWTAIAALFVLVGFVVQILLRPVSPPSQRLARRDLNTDGRVDILDALLLAYRIEQPHEGGALPDVNGDGAVDRRDAEAIAAQAVQLKPGSRS